MVKNRKLFVTIILILSSLIFFFLFLNRGFVVYADETPTEEEILADLFSSTNTYNISANNINLSAGTEIAENDQTKYSYNGYNYSAQQKVLTYNMSATNGNMVSDTAQITVLTHGLGGKASDWSNNYSSSGDNIEFTTSEYSLIYEYYKKYGSNLQVAFAKIKNDYHDYDLKDLTTLTISALSPNSNNTTEVYNTTVAAPNLEIDLDKHLLVVFEAEDSLASNDNMYFQFNYVLSKIAETYKEAEANHKLPKFNLIGHSRGGITNLQYALDHPDMVERLISIGTPYNGSTTALLFGSLFMGENSDALHDIVTSSKYNTYKTRWNSNLNLYGDIYATAIGAYGSLAFLGELVHFDYSNHINTAGAIGIDAAITAIALTKALIDCSIGFIANIGKYILSQALYKIFPDSYVTNLIEVLCCELVYDESIISFRNDILVDLNSQHATGYKNFFRKTRKFTSIGYNTANFVNVAQKQVPVIHNLETRDQKIMNLVMNAINTNYDVGFIIDQEDGKAIITHIEPITTNVVNGLNTWVVPSTVIGNGVTYTVKGISDEAFKEKLDDANVQKIIINNISYIGREAFADNYSLQEIVLNGISATAEIGEGVFDNCTSLRNVVFNNVTMTSVPTRFFNNCNHLQSISLPNTIKQIGSGAFSNCSMLSTVSGGNVEYLENGAFSCCCSLPQIPWSTTLKRIGNDSFANCTSLLSISLPDTITYIGDNAFSNCTVLSGITLPSDLTYLGEGAFRNCTSIRSITLPSGVTSINAYTFDGCTSLSGTVNLQNITYIGDYAFSNCAVLSNITLPSGLTYLGEGAFRNCESIVSIALPSRLTEINSYTFDGCTSLSGTVNLQNITYIGDYAFRNCNVNIWFGFLSSLTHIGAYAFYNNDSITSVIIPEGVDSVGDYAFAECDHLYFMAFNNPGINLYMYVDLVFENCRSISQILFENELLAQYHINHTYIQNLREKIAFTYPLTWTLITDAPSSLYNAYFTGYTFSQVIYMHMYDESHLPTIPANTGIIFFTCGTELYPSLFMTEFMEFYDYPIVIISPYLRHDEIDYNDYIPILSKDMFSTGYKIGSIMKDENEYAIEHIDDVGGFFPIIAMEDYKNNLAFLMGISCGLTVPVQVISSPDDLNVGTFQPDWSLIENWACVGFGTYSHDMIDGLLNHALVTVGYSNIYLFSTSESYISAMSDTYDNTYLIKDKQFNLTQIACSFFFDEELVENFYYDMQFNDYDGFLEPELMYDVWYPLWNLYLGYQFDEDSYADFYDFASNIVLVEQILISGNDISE